MTKTAETKIKDKTTKLATFYIGDALCGMDILKVQEINKFTDVTKVPQSPEYVIGILNLRGQIVTVIDIGKKIGLSSTTVTEMSRNIIIKLQNEYIGLLVDSIGDVVLADMKKIEKPPANIGGIQGNFFEGVFMAEKDLIGILDVEKVLKGENNH
ncbi:MAG: chemotaxis protein CheW [Thermodesulfobacteriota bacterium]|nr:chemotaxis protein CheW [Thermodesulfobacteriota bacterium]